MYLYGPSHCARSFSKEKRLSSLLQVPKSEDSKLEEIDDEDHRTPVAVGRTIYCVHILIIYTVRKASYYPIGEAKNPPRQ